MSMTSATHDGPTKGERTRRRILERAAALFNKRGGRGRLDGRYNAGQRPRKRRRLQSFRIEKTPWRWQRSTTRRRSFSSGSALRRARTRTPLGRLRALLDVYRNIGERPPLPGGCPLLNTAIDSDDTNAVLRDRVRAAMDGWRKILTSALDDAIRTKQLAEDIDTEAFASIVISALEGGVMLSSLYRDATHMRAVVDHLQRWLASLALPPAASVS